MPDDSTNAAGGCGITAFVRRVLVPTDFSETSQAALSYAVALVEQCGASIHLLHVLEAIAGAEPLEWQLGARSALERAIEESAWDDLRRQLPAHDQTRLRVTLALRWGAPVVEILRYAKAHKVDLITIGRHGRSGIKHLLIGSVVENVVRHAPCAVLSVRHPMAALTIGEGHGRPLRRFADH